MDERQSREVDEAWILLDARKELYGESDPATFDAMLHLGRALRDAGQLREAERVLTTSLSLQNQADGIDEGRVARTEFNLAIVVDRLGEHEAARRLWERVLQASDRQTGPDSELSVQDGRQPGHHPAQAPPLRRRVPAAGACARVDAADTRARTPPRPSGP